MSEGESHAPVAVGVDHVHAHPTRTGHRWLDLTIAISAIAISVISLFVAIQHGRTEEKLVAASSWPFLLYTSEYENIGTPRANITLKMENDGVGPARVESVRVSLDGRRLSSWRDLVRAMGVDATDMSGLSAAGVVAQTSPIGVIPARENVVLLRWQTRPGNTASLDALERLRHRIGFDVCYCSVLDECWVSDLKPIGTPRRVKACPIEADPFQ